MSLAHYNDDDPFAVRWLGALVDAGHIAKGRVDDRSIRDLKPADVAGPGQRHFFAGIGGWSYALRLAGVADGASVWTGSCPCQPFSAAGSGRGVEDERHLWPIWRDLIAECRPPMVFGEQVASAAGRGWLASVRADMEDMGYRVGAADLCAASVGAPHIRQRIFFGAVADSDRFDGEQVSPHPGGRGEGSGAQGMGERSGGMRPFDRLADSEGAGGREDAGAVRGREAQGRGEAQGQDQRRASVEARRTFDRSSVDWSRADYLPCRDGKARPAQPGTLPLAHGIPGRVGRLRGYGNAIVPQVAAAFVSAFLASA
mgnify:CR=1 FL=1